MAGSGWASGRLAASSRRSRFPGSSGDDPLSSCSMSCAASATRWCSSSHRTRRAPASWRRSSSRSPSRVSSVSRARVAPAMSSRSRRRRTISASSDAVTGAGQPSGQVASPSSASPRASTGRPEASWERARRASVAATLTAIANGGGGDGRIMRCGGDCPSANATSQAAAWSMSAAGRGRAGGRSARAASEAPRERAPWPAASSSRRGSSAVVVARAAGCSRPEATARRARSGPTVPGQVKSESSRSSRSSRPRARRQLLGRARRTGSGQSPAASRRRVASMAPRSSRWRRAASQSSTLIAQPQRQESTTRTVANSGTTVIVVSKATRRRSTMPFEKSSICDQTET